MTTPIQRAIMAMGGQAEAARKLDVTPGMVGHWFHGRNDVTPDRCAVIEAETGIRVETLLPELLWTRGVDGKVTGYHVPVAGVQQAETANAA